MFGDRLQKLRKDKGLTQKDIADLIKIAPSTVGMYEQGRRDPDTETLRILADYFNVSVDYLLGRTENTKQVSKDEVPEEFTDPEAARTYVKKHRIFASEGFNANKMDDEKILEFANALLEQMRLVGYKYRK